MDDAADNVISLAHRHLLWEELRNAVEWLDDLDGPLAPEQQAVLEEDRREQLDGAPTFAARALTAAERIQRARAHRPFDHEPDAPPDSAA
jgi:hypothetical protein